LGYIKLIFPVFFIFIPLIITFLNVIIARTRTEAEKAAIRTKTSSTKTRDTAFRAIITARQNIIDLDLLDKSPNALIYT
jgi:hypothetical protein